MTEHYDRLLRLAWLVCRDAVDAADAVQAGLELAWRRRETLRDTGSLQPLDDPDFVGWLDAETVLVVSGNDLFRVPIDQPRALAPWGAAGRA